MTESDANNELLVLRPAPSLNESAKRCWEQFTQPARDRIASRFRSGFWWAVWEKGKLRIKRQLTKAPGTAFGSGQGGSATPTLGAPIIEYDGEVISTSGLNDTDPVLGEVVDTMVELAKLLKERCHESGWACVDVSGAPGAVQKLKARLKEDQNAPEVYDAEITAAVERSRGCRD